MIPRKDYDVQKDGETVGKVTSGCYSPILEKNIGLAYVAKAHAATGNTIDIVARGRSASATIVKTPFV